MNIRDIMDTHICSFVPLRSKQTACKDEPTVFYGEKGYCKRHFRTVQALKVKEDFDKSSAVPVEPLVETPTPISSETSTPSGQPEWTRAPSDLPKNEEDNTPLKPLLKKKIIKPNKWGRYEDIDSHIIFEPKLKQAYGVQDHKTGKVMPLTDKHIQMCINNKWNYLKNSDDSESEEEDSQSEEEVSGEEQEVSEEEQEEVSEEQEEEEQTTEEEQDEEVSEEEQGSDEEQDDGEQDDEEDEQDDDEEEEEEEQDDEEEEQDDDEEEEQDDDEEDSEQDDDEEEQGSDEDSKSESD
jgi:hypothetical protein